MKKILLLLTFLCSGWVVALAQLPNGSTAPNFTAVDINGVPHTLYNLLDSGKTVFLDVFATWCGPCWNYHQTHALEEIWDTYGPNGTNEAYVMAIEGDASTSVNCIWGAASCTGGTIGDWTAGTAYPICDYAAIMNLYQVTYFPTIFMICPANKKVYEAGQQGASGLWAYKESICPPLAVATSINVVQNVKCYGTNTGSIDISATGGLAPYTYHWSNGAVTQDLVNIPAGTYTCTVTNAQGWLGVTDPIEVDGPPAPLNLVVVGTTPIGCGIPGTITVDAVGGWSANYTYLWNNGINGETQTAFAPGTFTVTVTDDNTCTKTLSASLAPAANPSVSIAPPGLLTCATPALTLTANASGGYSGTYEYQWQSSGNGNITSGANTANPTVNAAGNYSVQVTDPANNCTAFANVTVAANMILPNANAGPAMSVSCSTPTAVLQGTGSSGSNFSYMWIASNGGNISAGATTLTPTATAAGTYTLVVSNSSNGCTNTSSTAVAGFNTPPTTVAAGGTLTCVASSVALNTTTNAGNPGYSWTGPNNFTATVPNPSVNEAGEYIVMVVDSATGCTNADTAIVAVNTTSPGATATGGALTCVINSVELNATSATTGTAFAWTGPNNFSSAIANPSVSESGEYIVVVTDPANGCTSTAVATVETNTTAPAASAATPGNLNCQNTQLVLDGSGSSQGANFAYAWSTTGGNIVSGGNTLTPTVDAAGAYDLLVTNTENGCTMTASTTVAQTPVVTAAIGNQSNVLCHGQANGTAIALAGGGNASYAYAWSNGETTESVNDLAAGTYTVVVTDGEDCTAAATVVITQPATLAANAASTAQTAAGVNDGTATASPAGGTSAYEFLWNNGETTATISGLAPGSYTVTVTDANGCTAIQTVVVNAYNCAMASTVGATNVSCFGANDGTAAVTLLGANYPVQYTWNTGANTSSLENLAPGVYTVDVIDATNCAATLNVEITQPDQLMANTTATGETSLGSNDGTATANPSGGTSAYAYAWSNNETTAMISNLAPGAYTVTVTDANGCTDVQTVVVNAFNCALVAETTVSNVACSGQNNGSISVLLSGGAEPYTYNWSNGASTATISDLPPGNYTATVTDENGCDVILENEVTEPPVLESVSNATNPLCPDDNSGSISVQVDGGVGPYAYAWNTGATGNNLAGLNPGEYALTLTDANGCTLTNSYTLVATDDVAPLISAQNATLPLNASGSVSVSLQTLNASVTDNCSVANVVVTPATFNCDQLGEQDVTITATDALGNTSMSTITVTVVDDIAPVVSCPATITHCWYENVVSYDAPVAQDNCVDNGTWNLEAGLPSGSTFPVGMTTQTYTFKDASGNIGSCSFAVIITTPIDLAVTSVVNDVNNQGQGSIDITVSGGSQPYSFTWTLDNAVVGTTEDLTGLVAGTYKVEIKDANGCIVANEGITVGNTTRTTEPAWLTGVSLRPNPTNGKTQVVFAHEPDGSMQINVLDATGRMISTQRIEHQSTLTLDCTGLPEGVYLVQFRTGLEVGVRKLMVSH